MLTRFLGRPDMRRYHTEAQEYPWRPMDNREKLARWAAKYYPQYTPGDHQQEPQKSF